NTWTKIDSGIPADAFTRVVREDDVRKDLLFAGTELGLFLSWDGGKSWSPFQLNLPVTPITDLRVNKGNLIAATSGRSFWVLDDLSVIRQYKKEAPAFAMYRPDNAHLVNGGSELDRADAEFTGANPFRGVNPATGVVLYYQLPELKKDDHITLEIKDAAGNPVRSFSSKADEKYMRYDGGPRPEPLLPKAKGLNRFVWDMRYATMPGVPTVYIESSYAGHKAPPGKYSFTLKMGEQTISTETEILPNPLYPTSAADYAEFHRIMSGMESELTSMHRLTNSLYEKQRQLEALLGTLPADDKFSAVKKEGETLVKMMKAWDEDMVQRKAKAYDDVDNFANKFTANYLFLINQTESDIPSVNQPSLDRMKELNQQWAVLKARATEILDKSLPALNKRLWELGLGAIWKD
ncbi:MAG TPA: glycosyl hydrolase, partial [Blastocatellia bacterium]|nr:glycosyl hydrolase [Blastocatellia bacterium]